MIGEYQFIKVPKDENYDIIKKAYTLEAEVSSLNRQNQLLQLQLKHEKDSDNTAMKELNLIIQELKS